MKLGVLILLISRFLLTEHNSFGCSPDSVTITGEFKTNTTNKKVSFHFTDYIQGMPQTCHFNIDDKTGFFSQRIFIRTLNDIYFSVQPNDKRYQLLLEPGDSLHLVVYNDSLIFSGQHSKLSKHLYDFQRKYKSKSYDLEIHRLYSALPDAFLKKRSEIRDETKRLFNSYCEAQKCPEKFRVWFESDLKVNFLNDVLSYPLQKYPLNVNSTIDKERETYYNRYIDTITFHDSTLCYSYTFPRMLNSLSRRYKTPEATDIFDAKIEILLDIIESSKSTDSTSTYELTVLNTLKANPELAKDTSNNIARIYTQIFDKYKREAVNLIDQWYLKKLLSDLMKIPYSSMREIKMVNTFFMYKDIPLDQMHFYTEIRKYLTNTDLIQILDDEIKKTERNRAMLNLVNESAIVNYEDFDGVSLIAEIVKKNSPKLILFDFWATWCGPCIKDFDLMRAWKHKLDSTEVTFVYICCNSLKEQCLDVIYRKQVKGQHFFISEKQYDEINRKFGVNSFPTYFLIDSDRKIHRNLQLQSEDDFLRRLRDLQK